MDSIIKTVLVLLAGAALLVYTILNYISGKSDLMFLVVTIALVGYITISMVAKLIRDLRNK